MAIGKKKKIEIIKVKDSKFEEKEVIVDMTEKELIKDLYLKTCDMCSEAKDENKTSSEMSQSILDMTEKMQTAKDQELTVEKPKELETTTLDEEKKKNVEDMYTEMKDMVASMKETKDQKDPEEKKEEEKPKKTADMAEFEEEIAKIGNTKVRDSLSGMLALMKGQINTGGNFGEVLNSMKEQETTKTIDSMTEEAYLKSMREK